MLRLSVLACAVMVVDVGCGNRVAWPVRVAMVRGRRVARWASAIYVR